MKRIVLIFVAVFLGLVHYSHAQKSVDIDGRLQPLLNEFFKQFKKYNVDYNKKLSQLKNIDISRDLPLQKNNTVLRMVTRDAEGNAENILINWAAMLDSAILKVVAFHEFAHHFLDYKHTCQDCYEIIAVVNSSYFDIANEWDNQVQQLFITSLAYLVIQKKHPVTAITIK